MSILKHVDFDKIRIEKIITNHDPPMHDRTLAITTGKHSESCQAQLMHYRMGAFGAAIGDGKTHQIAHHKTSQDAPRLGLIMTPRDLFSPRRPTTWAHPDAPRNNCTPAP